MVDQTKDVFEAAPIPKDLISELVGEGKKFKTIDDLAQGKLQADIHITRLENEARELREKVAGAKTVDDMIEAIQAKTALVANPPKIVDSQETAVLPSNGLTAEQVAKIVAEQITGLETAKQKEANRNQSNALMKQMFGDKAQEKFNLKAVSPELRATLTQLAETSPVEFISLFKEKGQESLTGGSSSRNVNILQGGGNMNDAVQGTQLYYSKMRRENPKKYNSPAVQLEMHSAALKNPQLYFGRN